MFKVQVYHEKQDALYNVMLLRNENFSQLKEKVFSRFAEAEDGEPYFSIFSVEMSSSFTKQKKRNNHTPHESDNVYDCVMRLESCFLGRLLLRLVDLRAESNIFPEVLLSASERWDAAVACTSDKYDLLDSGSCTSWATTGYNSLGDGISGGEMLADNGAATANASSADIHDIPRLFSEPSILDSLFAELSSVALVQGRLHKKISNHRKQDIWREQYFILDGRMSRLWFFPITADHVGNGTVSNNSSSSARDLGISGLGVPSFIPLLCGANAMAQQSVLVSTHKSDSTCFTITITDEWAINTSMADRTTSEHRVITLRAPTADKAAKWVSRLSSLHIMLQQPLLAPGPENKRLYSPIMSKFLAKYGEGHSTYLAAVQDVLAKHAADVQQAAEHYHSAASTTLRACGGGGTGTTEDAAGEVLAIPVTARAASHWAANSMLESIEDCLAVTQQGNSDRDVDTLENLMTFEGMLKNKYLRGYFQKYLTNNCTEETLLFWEYAEDFWRAHPFSPHSFALASAAAAGGSSGVTARHTAANDILLALKQQDAVMLGTASVVRQWAESLYLTFIHPNAPYQLCCTTAGDVARVGAAIDQLASTDMPPYNLFRSIQLSAFKFMKTMCFPDFVAQPSYHRILIAAVHAADRGAINANLMASCVNPDREQSTFDHTVVAAQDQGASSQPSSGISYPAASSRGLLGMMKNMVISRRQSTGPASSSADQGSAPNKVDSRNYAARWRTTKLVVFELVRGDLDLSSSSTAVAATSSSATAASQAGSKKYRLGRRKGSSRSVIGDKIRKLRALQNGVVRKIGWLPEWWWDLVPHISIQPGDMEVASAQQGSAGALGSPEKGEAGDEDLMVLDDADGDCDESFLDDAEGAGAGSFSRAAHNNALLSPWTLWNDCDASWMPADMNYSKALIEKVRQSNARPHYDAQNFLHTELLVRKLVHEEERPPQLLPAGRSASLFLPAGWKPTDFSGESSSSHKSVESAVVPSKMKYTASIPKCVSQLNLTNGRALLEDYSHVQPAAFHMQVTLAGNGMLMLCSVVRCRYVRPTVKPVGMLMRGFSKRASNMEGSRKSEAHDGADEPSLQHSPGRPGNGRKVMLSGSSSLHRSESVCISASPLPVLPARVVGAPHQLQAPMNRPPRMEEFAAAGSATSSGDWPRQCAALYLCLGVPRLFLIDPVTLVPSACIDLHDVRKIAPTEQYLHSIDLQDRTHCTWQVCPEGIDPDDSRDATRRWLSAMSALCLPSTQVVHVLKSGYLHKRGRLNRAFKLRWFVLCSDLKLRYYKDDLQGIFKGTIDLSSDLKAPDSGGGASTGRGSGSSLPTSQQVVRFDKEIVVTMQATQRAFTLLAEDVATAEDWLRTLTDLLNSPLNIKTSQGSSSGNASGLSGRSLSVQSAEALLEAQEDLDDADEEEDD